MISRVDALRTSLDAGSLAQVTLIGKARAPDLVIAGSHCVALVRCCRTLRARFRGAHDRDRQHGRRRAARRASAISRRSI